MIGTPCLAERCPKFATTSDRECDCHLGYTSERCSKLCERGGLRASSLSATFSGVSSAWPATTPGLIRLPSGRLLRGRALRRSRPDGADPDFGLYLLGSEPRPVPWDFRWIRWRDFRLPGDPADTREALQEAWQRARTQRVEVACAGGRGRTGTALACIATLDGVPASDAVAFVRRHYDQRAVETLAQRRYIRRFALE